MGYYPLSSRCFYSLKPTCKRHGVSLKRTDTTQKQYTELYRNKTHRKNYRSNYAYTHVYSINEGKEHKMRSLVNQIKDFKSSLKILKKYEWQVNSYGNYC